MPTIEVFYLGSTSDLDTDETNHVSENTSNLVGLTFGYCGAPLYDSIDALTLVEFNGDGGIYTNDIFNDPEDISYVGTASGLDSVVAANVTITYFNGTTATTRMGVLHDVSGRVFLAPYDVGSAESDVLDDHQIVSIGIDSIVDAEYAGGFAYLEPDAFVTCFAAGTLIATKLGLINIAELRVGDKVCTMDHGYQPIRWIGARRIRAVGKFAPIRISQGALGQGLPMRDLWVSPQHRILVRSKIARRMFGCFEVLLAARKLTGMPGISVDRSAGYVTYWHFLFDHHELVFSEGAATESFYTSPQSMTELDQVSRTEILALFPELARRTDWPTPARPIVQGRQQNRLLERHQKNGRLIYQDDAVELGAAPLA